MANQLTKQILQYYAGKRILITGASGYLAANLIGMLKKIDCTIIRLSRTNNLLAISSTAKIVDIHGDIRTKEIWEQSLDNVDIVYHFAAQTSVYSAKDDPYADLQANVVPMLNLLETCKNKNLNPIILFSGTATEVGIIESLPIAETCKDLPITIYDMHKLMAENYLKYYCYKKIVRGATLRLANVYGPGPTSSDTGRGVLNMMIQKALDGKDLTVYGKGDCLRDYIYAEDVISAFLLTPIHIEQANGNYFVLGSGKGYTIAEAINLIADRAALKTKQQVKVKYIEPPPALSPIETRNFIADTKQFALATGWRACYSLTDGIDRTMDVFLECENN
jgi:UDP-glucose 4-epimerase